MSVLEEQSDRQELLVLLQESIKYIEQHPDEDILRHQTKFNVENGTGYMVTNKKFHLWFIKLSGK